VPAAKNTASKNHPKDILQNKNHLYRIVLVHLTLNFAFTVGDKIKFTFGFFKTPVICIGTIVFTTIFKNKQRLHNCLNYATV